METEYVDIVAFDWKSYFEKGKDSLKNELENDSEMFNRWTSYVAGRDYDFYRYRLVSVLRKFGDDAKDRCGGAVTGSFRCFIDAKSVESLKQLWESKFFKIGFDSTCQHFIVDMAERKIVEFLSVCM